MEEVGQWRFKGCLCFFFLEGEGLSRRDGAAVRAFFCGLGVALEEEAGSRQKEHELGAGDLVLF